MLNAPSSPKSPAQNSSSTQVTHQGQATATVGASSSISTAPAIVRQNASVDLLEADNDDFNDRDGIFDMWNNPTLQERAVAAGLRIYRTTWEDTARQVNSAFGPNISDLTLKMAGPNGRLCSAIRFDNFRDKTADMDVAKFPVYVGNETGQPLQKKTLKEYLDGICGDGASLFIERDNQLLVSAQTCVLPMGAKDVEFNAQLKNYHGAVLAIVCSPLGTSAQVLKTRRDQELFFNNNGKAANFVAARLKAERVRLGKAVNGEVTQEERDNQTLLIYQIPLKLGVLDVVAEWLMPNMEQIDDLVPKSESLENCSVQFHRGHKKISRWRLPKLGFDLAQLKIGKDHSPFLNAPKDAGIKLERDPEYPIRVTVQKYVVTDSLKMPRRFFEDIAAGINQFLNEGTRAGSLVIDADAHTRATAPGYLARAQVQLARLTAAVRGLVP